MGDKIVYTLVNREPVICAGTTGLPGDPSRTGFTYEWTTSNPADLDYLNDITLAQPQFTAPALTDTLTYHYVLNITRPESCVNRAPVKVQVQPVPAFTLENELFRCASAGVDLSSAISGVSSYTRIEYYSDAQAVNELASTFVYPVSDTVYYIKAFTIYGDSCARILPVSLTVAERAVWSPQLNAGASDSEKRNWNNPANWDSDRVPMECTDVYIPGNVTHYPFLDNAGATYVCNNIYFMHGAEIGQQQRLTYSKAHVQLNLGLEGSTQQTSQDIDQHLQFSAGKSGGEVSRSKWHMLSLPLQKIVTGDLAFGNYPLTYLRKFEASAPESGTYLKGNWSSYFRTLVEPLNPAEGFILWVNKYDNKFKYQEYRKSIDLAITNQEREYGLKQLNGILELPFFEKEDMSTAHRVHRFDEATATSTFNYVMETTSMPNYTEVTYTTENFNRGSNNEAYRFVSEMFAGHNVAHKVEVSPGMKFALVGNPYMSTLDFDAFYADNSQYIKASYQIWTEDGFSTYDPLGSSGKIMLDQYIAPMQSFLVELNDGVTTDFTLNFNVEDVSAIRPENTNSTLRAKPLRQDKLDIRLVNKEGSILTYIARNEQSSDQLSDMDSRKIISALRTTPEVYSLKKHLSGQTAVSTNFIKSNDQTIPLGIATTWAGDMHLNFSGMDQYNASISLIDTQAGTETDITGLTDYEYHFSYTPPRNASNQVEPDETRFFIRISSPVITGSEQPSVEGQLIVYTKDDNICVLSSESNIIRQLYVYDIKGSVLYANQHVNSAFYIIPGAGVLPGQCVVKIVSDKGVKNTKVIVK